MITSDSHMHTKRMKYCVPLMNHKERSLPDRLLYFMMESMCSAEERFNDNK